MMKLIILLSLFSLAPAQAANNCSKEIRGMEYFKDMNNKRQWIMRSNYFEVPSTWSVHGTFDHLALPKSKFPEAVDFSLDIVLVKKDTEKRLATYQFESHDNYFKTKGERISPLVQKSRSDFSELIFRLKNKKGKVNCEITLPFADEAH